MKYRWLWSSWLCDSMGKWLHLLKACQSFIGEGQCILKEPKSKKNSSTNKKRLFWFIETSSLELFFFKWFKCSNIRYEWKHWHVPASKTLKAVTSLISVSLCKICKIIVLNLFTPLMLNHLSTRISKKISDRIFCHSKYSASHWSSFLSNNRHIIQGVLMENR